MKITQSFYVPATITTMTVAGFVVGYKIAERRLVAQFEVRLEKETAGMKEFYQNAAKPYATPQEAAAALLADDDVDAGTESTATMVGDKIAYHKIVKNNYATDSTSEEDTVVGDDSDSQSELLHHNIFIEEPYIISMEEFMQNDSNYIQSTLTYYQADQVLTDERENVIDDVEETVGVQNMTKFGQASSDPNVVHIRNGRLQMEFEVCRNENSYRMEILGVEDDPPQLPSGRQR